MSALHRSTLTAVTLLLFISGAYAQQASSQEKTGTAASSERLPNGIRVNGYWSAPPAHTAVVKGAPYSAEEMTDRTQTLADGTHITQNTQIVRLYRDSEGRTRREWFVGSRDPSEGVMIVQIIDPVSGFRYLLDSYNHIAHRFAPPEKANEPVRYSQEAHVVAQGANATALQAVKPPTARTNPPEVSTESLGSQVMEGVSAEGKRVTRTFPVGTMGNDRPLVTVTESWFSPDLKGYVLTKTSDPRTGESIVRLRNIERSEPDAALFRAPPDYQIVDDEHDHAEIKIP